MVLSTAPPHPMPNASSILSMSAVGGAEANKNGFSKSIPKKEVRNVAVIRNSLDLELSLLYQNLLIFSGAVVFRIIFAILSVAVGF